MADAVIPIAYDEVVQMRKKRMKWNKIALKLGICRKTLYRWRKINWDAADDGKYSNISDDELDACMKNLMLLHRHRGEIMLRGLLESEFGVHVKWSAFRASILRVDPYGPWWRKFPRTNRGLYYSPGPNYTWHMDSNHKLRAAKLVIHGSIDGFSRHINYLVCCDNNRSSTVLNIFRNCVREYGVPQRMYSDLGGENIQVAHYMVAVRGPGLNNNTVMVGKSVHNQRIERLWRDINSVTHLYKLYFHKLINQHEFQFDDCRQRYIINRLFIPLINDELDEIRRGYNDHKMRTLDRRFQSPNEAVKQEPNFAVAAPHHVPIPVVVDNALNYNGIVVEANICPLPANKQADYEAIVPSLRLAKLKEDLMIPGPLNPVLDTDGVMQNKYHYFDEAVQYACYVYQVISNTP